MEQPRNASPVGSSIGSDSPTVQMVAAQLDRWRDRLIDLTRRNPLISFRTNRAMQLRLAKPEPAGIFERIVRQRQPYRFWTPPDGTSPAASTTPSATPASGKSAAGDNSTKKPRQKQRADELLCEELERRELQEVLTQLYRRSRSDYLERGLRSLHLAFGMLEWPETPNGPPIHSPLVLLPVVLSRPTPREPFALSLAEDEPTLNPALSLRFQRELDLKLPAIADWDDEGFTLDAYFNRIESAVEQFSGFRLTRSAILGLFSFDKGVMHLDLTLHAEMAIRHPMIRALAGEAINLPRITPPEESTLDTIAPVESRFTILDADASQLRAVEAGRQGQSFVLIGPPGTGKSQTIANLIADRLAVGQSVLFVSAKMAALEVVHRRLEQAGLGDCCLEVHSQLAQRGRVVQELFRTLHLPPDQSPDDPQPVALQQRRAQLNALVQAMHRLREPLGISVAEALERIAQARRLPRLELDELDQLEVRKCDSAWYESAKRIMQRLARLGRMLDAGQDTPWEYLRATEYSLSLQEELAAAIDRVQAAISRREQRLREVIATLQLPSSLIDDERLRRASSLADERPAPLPPMDWWQLPSLDPLRQEIERHTGLQHAIRQQRRTLTDRNGPAIWAVPPRLVETIQQAWTRLQPLMAHDPRGTGILAESERLHRWCLQTGEQLPDWRADAQAIADALGLTANFRTPRRLRMLLDVVDLLRQAPQTPVEPAWFGTGMMARVQAVFAACKDAFAASAPKRDRLLARYDERLFSLDLDRLAADFTEAYQSRWRWLDAGYRRDCQAIQRVSRDGTVPTTLLEDLRDARELLRRDARFETEFGRERPLLGRYTRQLAHSDGLESTAKAIALAGALLDALRTLEQATIPSKLIDLAAHAQSFSPEILARADRLRSTLSRWQSDAAALAATLPQASLPGSRLPLLDTPLDELAPYVESLRAAVEGLSRTMEPLLHRPVARPTDLLVLLEDLRQVDMVRGWTVAEEAEFATRRNRFGDRYLGLDDTNWSEIRQCLDWVQATRELFAPDAVPEAFLRPTPGLNWSLLLQADDAEESAAWAALQGYFRPERSWNRPLSLLRDRLDELPEWFDWKQIPEAMQQLGLRSFLEQIRERAFPAERLVELFDKAFLTAWLDAIRRDDPALRDFRGEEHEHRIEEFRQLDREQITRSARRVMRGVAARRPTGTQPLPGSEVEQLHRQALIRVRHRPLRQLFADLPTLLMQLKPCLLMSPMSVSQLLTRESFQFDLVIFDEASQIPPEDAIGAMMRGRQIIVVGDDQQLPPSDFFTSPGGLESEDDPAVIAATPEQATYASILDQCRAVLPSYMLRWHYRSRDEGLIAFSNHAFYEGRLITFPAADLKPADRGVVFHHVPDGVYERGGRRHNKREAETVADLVFEQLRRAPDRTVGVIAFSQAQMRAIEDQLERRRRAEPAFEDYFRDDRLESVFVRNLETVQGDERDVIFLSVGYGRDQRGRPSMNFGPLNRLGGERRLNVAVTRARERLVVVSSLKAIDLEGAQSEGVRQLRRYLDFAERGIPLNAPDRSTPQGAARLTAALPMSSGESSSHGAIWDEISEAIQRWGFEAIREVGTSSGRVDLAVRDPKSPNRWLLGLLGDGPRYRDAATARDRDRLRPDILAGLGWRLYRIWTLDWLTQRQRELDRLRQAIEQARAADRRQTKRAARKPESSRAAESTVVVGHANANGGSGNGIGGASASAGQLGLTGNASGSVLASGNANGTMSGSGMWPVEPMQFAEMLPGTVPYQPWVGTIADAERTKDFADAAMRPAQREWVRAIVAVEAPVHVETVLRRLAKAWGIDRLHERYRKVAPELFTQLDASIQRRGDFLYISDPRQQPVPVRVPVAEDDRTQRAAVAICPEEWREAMRLIVRVSVGIDAENLLRQAARLFGLRLLDPLREMLEQGVQQMLSEGQLVRREERLALPDPRLDRLPSQASI
ncbi:DUF3320 domain-containing protein [Tuwongella immobilis]|uniref:Uncharacterized protein n=1 Tax=Tuwongella immobilis TaxID=692036 RepID=A0A6C2YJ21_9BACT|nr:DUF3320 domain-containing protein [Tuwongella immobilis]VIP01133.1 Uncharacterized protein OS=Tannerella sp. CAG:51 GN=BN686_02287 PE=4 SV=1: DUF4011: AAA_19: AAA_11: AAA_12: DUF3320 [Tuwongella immobilis]VTR97691.1 Uncharacterized protein OS=Tannerella sp. CAG:51 GN=BN686_02287 PE=4 SV=1: DUF4011: AAA_19: AAA_11: AAA_12: DUF3320 [Tuwongella immobilis]